MVELRDYPFPFSRDRFEVEKNTKSISFAQESSYQEGIVACGCVVVCTSDGERGTLSHLAGNHDPLHFAKDLRDLLGKSKIPVCLYGGMDNWTPSLDLANGLLEGLRLVGFVVSKDSQNSDLLGKFNRTATLFANYVEVMRRGSGEFEYKPKILRFPRV